MKGHMERPYIEIGIYCRHCGGKLKARTREDRPRVAITIKDLDCLEYVHTASGERPCSCAYGRHAL